MESKIVSINEIKKDNPRLCLLPIRYLGKCYQCNLYEKCESKIINPEGEKILNRRIEIKEQIKKLKTELESMTEKWKFWEWYTITAGIII